MQLNIDVKNNNSTLLLARWIPVPMTGSVPPACSHFSLTQVSQRRAVLFGGFAAEIGCAVNAVHIIDLETMVYLGVLMYTILQYIT